MSKRMPKTITGQLRWYIQESGVSTYRLEREIGIHNSVLSRFLRNERGLSLDAVDTLGKYFKLRLVQDKSRRKTGRKQ